MFVATVTGSLVELQLAFRFLQAFALVRLRELADT